MPPTVVTAPKSADKTIADANVTLAQALQQAQTDSAALESLVANWPGSVPKQLQPLADILLRVLNDVTTLAEAMTAMAKKEQLI